LSGGTVRKEGTKSDSDGCKNPEAERRLGWWAFLRSGKVFIFVPGEICLKN
jgi:hypothetical protein